MNRIEWISETKVMKVAAGYFVGKDVTDEMGTEPYDRYSGYYLNREYAEQELKDFNK